MLNKKNRISVRDFPKTERPQKIFTSESFSLSVFSKENLSVPKASVVVSKKIAKTAVERNKIRRRIYSILQKIFPSFKKSVLLIFYPKKSALEKPTLLIKKEINNLLVKI